MLAIAPIIFFVVTETSLYRVTWEPGHPPVITKIALRPGRQSRVPIGDSLCLGDLVDIRGSGLITYLRASRRPSDMVNNERRVDNTSGVVGLFMDEDDARHCLVEPGLQMLDPRFRQPTEEVLAAIGNDHPVFFISRGSFVYPEPSPPPPAT
ncbi:MAG: hypothetical protein WC702_02915 [Patescibacteria group bacterium]|jgi:hypothetical protein